MDTAPRNFRNSKDQIKNFGKEGRSLTKSGQVPSVGDGYRPRFTAPRHVPGW